MMARKDRADASWSQEIISYLIEKGYFMIQMPCPEASFPDHATGIARKPHGLKYYQELSGFRDYCSDIGKQVLEQIDAFYDNGYKISAVLGVEHSPACAVNYIYTNQGTKRMRGIFIQQLSNLIKERGYDIAMVGINRHHPQKTVEYLEKYQRRNEEQS